MLAGRNRATGKFEGKCGLNQLTGERIRYIKLTICDFITESIVKLSDKRET